MEKYIVKRRETIVVPKSVEIGSKVNHILNVIFLTWSIMTIILYFSNIQVSDSLDIGVSLLAIGISISYQVYKYYMFRKSEVNKIFDDPDEVLRRKNAQNIRKQAIVTPFQINSEPNRINVKNDILDLNSIDINSLTN
jgi:hypothetical protein